MRLPRPGGSAILGHWLGRAADQGRAAPAPGLSIGVGSGRRAAAPRHGTPQARQCRRPHNFPVPRETHLRRAWCCMLPSSSTLDCPARGYRFKGALRTSILRFGRSRNPGACGKIDKSGNLLKPIHHRSHDRPKLAMSDSARDRIQRPRTLPYLNGLFRYVP